MSDSKEQTPKRDELELEPETITDLEDVEEDAVEIRGGRNASAGCNTNGCPNPF